jgi:hypothetical protein
LLGNSLSVTAKKGVVADVISYVGREEYQQACKTVYNAMHLPPQQQQQQQHQVFHDQMVGVVSAAGESDRTDLLEANTLGAAAAAAGAAAAGAGAAAGAAGAALLDGAVAGVDAAVDSVFVSPNDYFNHARLHSVQRK